MKTSSPYSRPAAFNTAFDAIWIKLFTSPIHLDSALSQAPKSLKSSLAVLTRLILQRPASLAKFLRFRLNDEEPWYMGPGELMEWNTVRVMADRLLQTWRKDPEFYLEGRAIEADYPPWMVEEWKRDYGSKVANDLIVKMAAPPPLFLRASSRKGRDEVLSALNDSKLLEIRAKLSTHAPFAFYFPDYAPVQNHPHFKEGAYEIQDLGSQVMSLFALWPNEFLPMLRKIPSECRAFPKGKELPPISKKITVIDACAGAGGKTLAMADVLKGKGQFFAYDVSQKKLDALRKRAVRGNLQNIKTVLLEEGAEEKILTKHYESADVVLVDSPCSGWGVLRRNPDIKWRQKSESLRKLEKLQARLLDLYAPLVKPGGTLTYGVCTFRKSETTDQVEAFLKRNSEFESIGGGFYGPDPSDAFFFHGFRRKTS